MSDMHVLVDNPPVRFIIPGTLRCHFGILNDVEICQDDGQDDGQEERKNKEMAWPSVKAVDMKTIIEYYANRPATTAMAVTQLDAAVLQLDYVLPMTQFMIPGQPEDLLFDVLPLIRLINTCNFLDCEELLVIKCAYAAAHIIGRTALPALHPPERRQQKDQQWTLFRELLVADAAYIVDRHLPFESQPFTPFEERRSFLVELLVKSTAQHLTKEELAVWPAFQLHSLAVDLQHIFWQQKYNRRSILTTVLITAFTKYDCINLDRFLLRLPTVLHFTPGSVAAHMIARHIDHRQYASAAAIANGREEYPVPTAADAHMPPVVRGWRNILTTGGNNPESFSVLPLLNKKADIDAVLFHLMWRYIHNFDWSTLLQVSTRMPVLALKKRHVIIQMAARRASPYFGGQIAGILCTSMQWSDMLWGAVHCGDENGDYLMQYVLNQPSFWSSPQCHANLLSVIDIDVRCPAHRTIIRQQIREHSWNADQQAAFQAAYIAAEWIEAQTPAAATVPGAEEEQKGP